MIRRRELALVAVLLAVTAAVYGTVAGHDFVHFDDGVFVYDNPQVRAGLTPAGLVYAFTNWEHRIWAPLTWLSHMADVQCFGVEGQFMGLPASGWHHLTNLALHLACVLLLYAFLRTATGAVWRSALVAAFFALHPLHVESVAWISERKTLLSTAFGFACLWSYVVYARRPGATRYLTTLALLALGLMSKPMLVTWPFVMLLLDWWPLGRLASRARWGRLLLEKLPLFALVAASGLVTFLAQRPAMHLMEVVPFGFRLQNAVVACSSYVIKTFWPTGLAVVYPYRSELPALLVGAAAVFLLAVTWVVLRLARRSPYAAWGWFWFLGTLVPVLGLVQVGLHSMADRYTYVTQVGLLVALVWGTADLVRRWELSRWAVASGCVAVLAACAFASARQARFWSDTEALFRHTCSVTENNGWAHRILGTALSGKGRPEEAIGEYRIALSLWPDDPIAHNNLGQALSRLGRIEEALGEYAHAARLAPEDATCRANLGSALALEGRFEESIRELRAAVRLQPDDAALHHALGVALLRSGDGRQAAQELREAGRLAPDEAGILIDLADLLATSPDPALRDGPQAVRLAERARGLRGDDDPITMDTLAAAYAAAGRFEQAMATAESALRSAQALRAQPLAQAIAGRLELYRRGQAAGLPSAGAAAPGR